jgi:hypothetical protein
MLEVLSVEPYCKLVFPARLFAFNISRAKVYGLKTELIAQNQPKVVKKGS